MPVLGGGYAALKWVTSFPGNPERGLPTVTGLVLLSDASDGSLVAVFDAGAVTALRTGAAAVPRRGDARPARHCGCDRRRRQRPGRGRARFVANGSAGADLGRRRVARPSPPPTSSGRPSPTLARTRLAADVVVTVTPGHEVLFGAGSLRPGQHVSLMGADGPGKAEIAVEELVRTHVFCDDWEQASHNGELVHAVEAGLACA